MPLGEPPAAAGSLTDHPPHAVAGTELVRVWRKHLPNAAVRASPWWFASAPADPSAGGRFDLPAPSGACYVAQTVAGAVLEALQAQLTNLPAAELAARSAVRTEVPTGMPPAVDLTDPVGVALGLTSAVWAETDRPLTQRWAAAFRRDGWWALHGGIQHDLSGRLRGVSLFDHAGEHEPTHAGPWPLDEIDLLDDRTLVELAGRCPLDTASALPRCHEAAPSAGRAREPLIERDEGHPAARPAPRRCRRRSSGCHEAHRRS